MTLSRKGNPATMPRAPDFFTPAAPHFLAHGLPHVPLLRPVPSTHQILCFGLRGSAVCSPPPPSALCQSPGGLGRGSSCQVGPPGWGYTCPHLGRVCPYGSMVTVSLLSSFLSCNWQQCPINSSRCWKPLAQCCLRQRVNLGGENQSANSHALALSFTVQKS